MLISKLGHLKSGQSAHSLVVDTPIPILPEGIASLSLLLTKEHFKSAVIATDFQDAVMTARDEVYNTTILLPFDLIFPTLDLNKMLITYLIQLEVNVAILPPENLTVINMENYTHLLAKLTKLWLTTQNMTRHIYPVSETIIQIMHHRFFELIPEIIPEISPNSDEIIKTQDILNSEFMQNVFWKNSSSEEQKMIEKKLQIEITNLLTQLNINLIQELNEAAPALRAYLIDHAGSK